MLKAFPAAVLLTVAALGLSAAPAHAQININIGRPAPQYVVVRETRPVKKYKAPKYKKGAVLLVPAGPVYYEPRGHGHGRGRGRH
ncbi:hypothetical protein SAMN02745146_0738 [Hymenobacter daecheongensis DSM 21074]|uniref:Uncharacterized protein n=1 Tax=Hymenobacter daecheongensis DSM 21074 TaxID=1121955 RepID=A0A1M6AS80_9BACT|nr:hypothetical protein [Hymenobacter daecheongensis]SHI39073.1 hypothetical protein SAMN02745146_0738 [Hymenobacter daecheongensis DSM 21074]